ncbi:MAG: hypothetical protein ACP5ER_05450, partial [Candidatus Bathyarchaeales archaeon]
LFDLATLKELGGFKAGDLLAVDPELYQKFMEHLGRTVKRDDVAKNIVFLTGLSAYTEEPINLFLRGESSTGKSYNVVQALKYFPKEDVWLLGGLSPKALIHSKGKLVDENGEEINLKEKPEKPNKKDYPSEHDYRQAFNEYKEERERWIKRLENSRYLVDLTGKTLVFLEAPHIETLNMLRPILSHDAYEISYRFTDKDSKGKLQTQHVIIRGWPATIFCSTQEKYVHDLATRGFTVTPETTEQKYRDANILTGNKAAYPWKFQQDFDLLLLEGYIRFLKNNLGNVKVVIPYAKTFAEKFPCRFPRSMRDFKHILNLIKVVALFHFAQRPVLIRKLKVEVESEDPTVPEYKEVEEHYIMATKQDYDVVMALWNEIRETTETSAPGHIIKFYHEVVKKVAKEKPEFTVEDLVDEWNKMFDDKKSNDSIGKWVRYLCQIGYMNKRPDPTDKRRNQLKIIKENGKNRQNPLFKMSEIFGLDSFKAWLNEANQISATNHLSLRENLLNEQDASIKQIYEKYFLSEKASVDINLLSDLRRDLAEKPMEKTDFQKSGQCRNFQPEDLKAVYWSDQLYDWHPCCICGYQKLTSWQAETFKGDKLWICEDCKLEWEKRRNNID